MANEEPNAEIEALREQLAELKREREAARVNEAEPEADAVAEPDIEVDAEEAAAEQPVAADEADQILETVENIGGDLAVHFKELMDTLDEDLKTTRASTLLIVFVLGVLVGRLR